MLCNIQDKRSLTHGRSCRHENEIRRLESGHLVVQINKSRWNTGDCALTFGSLFDLVKSIKHDLADWYIVPCISLLYQLKNIFFRFLQDPLQGLLRQVTGIGNSLCQPDQFSKHRLFRHDIRIVLDIG